jgi:D-alanine-D-alanine ligase
MGGWSGEHEVSLRTGAAIVAALGARGYDARPIVLTPEARDRASQLLGALREERVDVVVLALHGRLGEDGCVQGLFELAAIPYTGSGVLASALAMDKVKAKELFLLHNVPTPPYYMVEADADLADVESLHRHFGFPVVVKPRAEGSSLGLSVARSPGELARALERALCIDDFALVERFVEGAEITVGIVNGRVLGTLEIVPREGLYDYTAKYTPGATDYFMPARLPPARQRNVLNLAKRAADALGTTGAVRVDLIVTPGDNEYVLEVNTLPGMTETSLLPKIAAAAGFDFGALVEEMLRGARLHTPVRDDRDADGRRSGTVLSARALAVPPVPVAESA